MTNEEIKGAFSKQSPVICGGIEYARISAIIYRHDAKGKIIISAELKDKHGNSVTIARIQDIQGVSECNL